jgi:hypothetical protein
MKLIQFLISIVFFLFLLESCQQNSESKTGLKSDFKPVFWWNLPTGVAGYLSYYGYGESLKNSIKTDYYAAFNVENDIIRLNLFEVDTADNRVGGIHFKIHTKEGMYYSGDTLGTEIHATGSSDGCVTNGYYTMEDLVPGFSYFNLLSYNSWTRTVKGRFRLRVVLDDYSIKSFPDIPRVIILENGVVHTKKGDLLANQK